MKKICVVTGTRAEYGLLSGLMKKLRESSKFRLQVVVTGMHLSPAFGETFRDIEADGFAIDAKVEMLLSSDSPVAIAKSLGLGTIGFADAMVRLAPDLLVVLGDRFEVFAAAQTAMLLRVPIVHLHGGESTEGAIDEAIRHALTKMAHIHFVATNEYRRRVIQLGEDPARVFNVGALGVENIIVQPLLTRVALEDALDFRLGDRYFLVTYHPETLSDTSPRGSMAELINALEMFRDAKVVITYPNADTHGHQIVDVLEDYARRNPDTVLAVRSLGQEKYLSAMKYASAVIGNSSSGIIEAPTMGVPTVNVGSRQHGRVQADSIVNCDCDKVSIVSAISKALEPRFVDVASRCVNPYYQADTSEKMVGILEALSEESLLIKRFYDIDVLA